ncbi:P-loop containing nucleoside triphosphate hydrolase protein [Coprinopsis marcescibilis]|uniref:P-loop containing nucleoside triphosphate hydrolase protein n=1 Tax=Coprinopsis marcescibilis TaxID=230819 RepID=A0A5C3KLR2_COPMA|nr:P-loop containing nucleoside triphosphate hydrolase protein [Coprinopsis marcescibilis]
MVSSVSNAYSFSLQAGKIEVHNTRGTFTVQGTITKGAGRNGHITTSHNTVIDLASVQSVETFGRDRLTNAEQHRAAAVLRMLQGNLEAFETSPFITNIWFPEPDGLVWPPEWAKEKRSTRPASDNLGRQTPPPELPTLNGSQQKAVNNMLHHRKRLVIVQGPPGTGKTSVIGSCVAMAANKPIDGIWLIAQSNVAVKNIALKLQSIQFEGWKILVSKDFIHEWHEHLYDETLKAHMIVSTRFSQVHPKEEFKGCKVVLCTLSMLSNYHVKRFTQQVPLQLLIVDEASQIEIGNYFSVLENFSKTLRKICFIGDDKQLPPHGEEDLKTLQSIFEVPHLKNEVIFLNTQYRMPPQIGNIISSCVYDDQLGSNPLHKVPDTAPACYFIDISAGREETDGKGSWKVRPDSFWPIWCLSLVLTVLSVLEYTREGCSYWISSKAPGCREEVQDYHPI